MDQECIIINFELIEKAFDKVQLKLKKQSKLNKMLLVVSVVTLAYAYVEIENLKEEIKELKNKKGV